MSSPNKQKPKKTIPEHYTVGDELDWNAPWIDVCLWTELPFWLMVNNSTLNVECEGHVFPVAVHDNYFEFFFGAATDSRATVGYRGPWKNGKDLPAVVRKAISKHPNGPFMWRKCKTYLKVQSRCNEDVLDAARGRLLPRANAAKLYLSELCRSHIPVINRLIQAYRLATYDYFAFEVAPWDVPRWTIERHGRAISSTLVSYRDWDVKPLIYNFSNPSEKPKVHTLIETQELRSKLSSAATAGEFELLDALNLMERGDYSGAVRRVTTAIEVIVEDVAGKAMETANGKQAAEKFLKDTRMRFDERVKTYQKLTGRKISDTSLALLKETRNLRHRIVHGGHKDRPCGTREGTEVRRYESLDLQLVRR